MVPGLPVDPLKAKAKGSEAGGAVAKKLQERNGPDAVDPEAAALEAAEDADRGWAPGRRRLVVTAIFVAAVAAMVRRTPAELSHQVLGNLGDPLFIIWTLRWDGHALLQRAALTHPSSIFNANIFWPYPHTLAYADDLLSIAPVYNAFYAVTHNWALSLNLLWLCDLGLNMGATYSLARWLTRRTEAGVLAGLASGFSAFVLSQVSHQQLQLIGLVPLALLLLFKLLERPRLPLAVGLGVVNVVIVLSAQYWAALYAMAVLVVLIGWLVHKRGRIARRLIASLAVAAAVTLVAAPSVIPYTEIQSITGTRQLAPIWTLHPRDIFRAAAGSYLYKGLSVDNVAGSGERHLFPGFLTMALALTGIVVLALSYRRPRPPESRGNNGTGTGPPGLDINAPAADRRVERAYPDRRIFLVLVAAVGFAAAVLAVGAPHNLWTPWRVVYEFVPGAAGIRVTARLAAGSILAGACLAGYGLDAILRHVPRPSIRLGVSTAACLFVAVELAAPLPWVSVPTAKPLLAVYHALAHEPAGAVVELPMTDPMTDVRRVSFTEPIREMWATIDWHPRLNGYSGYQPMTYDSDAAVLANLPSAAALARLQQRHIRYLVLHLGVQAGYPMFTQAQANNILAGLPHNAQVTRYGPNYLVDLDP